MWQVTDSNSKTVQNLNTQQSTNWHTYRRSEYTQKQHITFLYRAAFIHFVKFSQLQSRAENKDNTHPTEQNQNLYTTRNTQLFTIEKKLLTADLLSKKT